MYPVALIDPKLAIVGSILFLLASQDIAQKSLELTAVLTQIEGQVTLSRESQPELRSVRRATQRQVIRRGETVHLPTGAQLTLICSTETLVSLTGPRDWVLDATACGRGLPLPAKSYNNLASYAGRILPRNGSLLLELETRNVEMGLGPILLSPRNTAVIDANPSLTWTRVPEAIEYEIEIRGPIESSIRVAAGPLHCGHSSGPWHDLDVCSWTPSGRWPVLEPEKSVFLKLGYRQTLTASFRQVREVYQINRLSVNDQRGLQEGLRQIAILPVDKASRLLLTAGAYAQVRLYADAIATYHEALQAEEIPEARVTLGDLYLSIGLTALADREYRQILASTSSTATQAAAELGLGQVAYFCKHFGDAQAHFERARGLYTILGLPAEAEEAQAAAAAITSPGLR